MAQKYVTVAMVLAYTDGAVEQKVSRVFTKASDADKYVKEVDAAIKAGQRPDLLAAWLQTNVRIF